MPATIDQTTSFATSVSDMSSSTNTKPTCIGTLSTLANRRRTLSTVARDHVGNRTTANSLNQMTITVVQTRSSQCTMDRMMAKIVILIPSYQKPFVSTFTHFFQLFACLQTVQSASRKWNSAHMKHPLILVALIQPVSSSVTVTILSATIDNARNVMLLLY